MKCLAEAKQLKSQISNPKSKYYNVRITRKKNRNDEHV